MIITLSRQRGSGGDAIAARVAAAMGLRLADREYVHSAALAAGLPESLLHELLYERQRSLAAEILASLGGPPRETVGIPRAANPLGGLIAPMLPPASTNLDEGMQLLSLVIKDIANRGNVLVLGQGGQVLLRDYQGACHVQIVAPLEARAAAEAGRGNIPLPAARRQVRESDRDRAEYLSRYFNINWLDPLLYHLVINTGRTPPEVAVSLIVNASQALAAAAGG